MHQLAVHTVGGVISAGEAIMLIVPEPRRADRRGAGSPRRTSTSVQVGQPAVLRFSAFNQRTTPEINGEVSRVSADVTQDQKTGASFYVGPHRACRRRRSPASAA